MGDATATPLNPLPGRHWTFGYDSMGNRVSAGGEEWKANNGDFEVSAGGKPIMKGTYTTSGDKNITITVTHVHGSAFEGMLESKWYTKAELKASPIGAFVTDAELNEMFVAQAGTYSVSGNTLTMTMGGETSTYTKKP
jgi:hypothetical protein